MILTSLLFSTRSHIHRPDWIYGTLYGYLLLLVSWDALSKPLSLQLIGGGMDTWGIAQYMLSIVGAFVGVWILVAIHTKRARTLGYLEFWGTIAVILPPLALVGFLPDSPEIRSRIPRGGIMDQLFFFVIMVIIGLSTMYVYRLDFFALSFLSVILLVSFGALIFFAYDHAHGMPREAFRGPKYQGFDAVLDLFLVILIVFFIRLFIFSPFQIIGPSMESTFHGGSVIKNAAGQYGDGEYILVDKMSYQWGMPHRGDVVVFSPRLGPDKKYLIKRVIGLPGDRVKIENGSVFIDAAGGDSIFIPLNETYLNENNQGKTFANNSPDATIYEVPLGHFFLMGDNRRESLDARGCFGNCVSEIGDQARYIPQWAISGKVGLSLGHFDIFSRFFKPYTYLPAPVWGTWTFVVPFRWADIANTHEYPELTQ